MESGLITSWLTILSREMEAGISTSLVTFLAVVVRVPPPTAMYLYLLRNRSRTLGSLVILVSVSAVSWTHLSHRFSLTSGARVFSTSCCRDAEHDTEESERSQKKLTSSCLTWDLWPQAQQAKVSCLSYWKFVSTRLVS